MIADHAVVADVRVRHDQVVAADASHAAALDRAAMHGAEFAKLVRVAHLKPHALAGVCQVLRIAADNGKRMHMIVPAERGGSRDHGVRFEDAAFAEFDIVADDREGPDSDSAADFRGFGNDCPGINVAHRAFSAGTLAGGISVSRSTILHISVASAASSPLTVALAMQFAEAQTFTPGDDVHFQPQLISGNDRSAETRIVNRDEIQQLFFALRHFLKQQEASRLRHGFDDQDSRHDWLSRKMPLKIAFIDCDVLDSHNALPSFHFFNAIYQKERVAMRQNLLDIVDVEKHG